MDSKHRIGKVLAPLCVMLAAASCSTDNTTSEVTPYCAVTQVTLGTQKRVMHTTTVSGADSTYTVSVSGSYYPMYIDQINGLIYNGDSLPYGTDQAHIVLSRLDCEGVLAMRTASGQDSAFSVSSSTSNPDSIDFTQPRTIVVYGYDGLNRKEYTMSVNVHQEDGEQFPWRSRGTLFELADMRSMSAVSAAGALWVFGTRLTDGLPYALQSADDGASWTSIPLTGANSIDTRSVMAANDKFYALADSTLLRSDNGTAWTPVGSATPLSHLLCHAAGRLYAISRGEFVCSTDGGTTWQVESRDTDGSLPTGEAFGIAAESSLFNHIVTLTAGGTSGDSTVVWYKQVDTRQNTSTPWTYMPRTNENPYTLPALQSLQTVAYDGHIMAIGLTSEGLSPFYTSADYGRTWINNEPYTTPERASAMGGVAMLCTDNHFVWLFCSGSGEMWRGRLNRLGWAENQTSFTRTARP